jgi:hypothetical protein
VHQIEIRDLFVTRDFPKLVSVQLFTVAPLTEDAAPPKALQKFTYLDVSPRLSRIGDRSLFGS